MLLSYIFNTVNIQKCDMFFHNPFTYHFAKFQAHLLTFNTGNLYLNRPFFGYIRCIE